MSVGVLASLLLIHLPANAPRKAGDDGPSVWVEFLDLALAWPSPVTVAISSKPAAGRSLLVSPSDTVSQIN